MLIVFKNKEKAFNLSHIDANTKQSHKGDCIWRYKHV